VSEPDPPSVSDQDDSSSSVEIPTVSPAPLLRQEHPRGWELILPNGGVLHVHNYSNYDADINHRQKERTLDVVLTSHPPTIAILEECYPDLTRRKDLGPEVNFRDPSITSQLSTWKPETWRVVLPAPPPLATDDYAAFGYTHTLLDLGSSFDSSGQLSFIWIPSYSKDMTRNASMRKDRPVISEEEKKALSQSVPAYAKVLSDGVTTDGSQQTKDAPPAPSE
jgi:hypothetical protein